MAKEIKKVNNKPKKATKKSVSKVNTKKQVTKKKIEKKVDKKTIKKANTGSKKIVKSNVAKTNSKKNTEIVIEKDESINKVENVKKEKWYVWLKNNIIENEEKYSKEDRNRRLLVSLFAIFCFVVVLLSTCIIDYNYATQNNTIPMFVVIKRDEYKQATIYYGAFYKAWRCDNGYNNIIYGRFSSEVSYCKLEASYNDNGIYTNPNGVEISKAQMNAIVNYYYDEFINFKTQKDLDNAIKISNAINRIWWVRSQSIAINEQNASIAIFGKMESDGWKLQYNNNEYYKCVKNVNGINIFSDYNYLDNTCGSVWETLTLDDQTCELAKNNNSVIKDLVINAGYCK